MSKLEFPDDDDDKQRIKLLYQKPKIPGTGLVLHSKHHMMSPPLRESAKGVWHNVDWMEVSDGDPGSQISID